jgi:hypothetical protein
VCDYTTDGKKEEGKEKEEDDSQDKHEVIIERFRHAVHKVIVLNRRKDIKQFKLFDLFDNLKEKRNEL